MKTWLLLIVVVALLSVSAVSADFGTNWTANYYNSTDLTGPIVYTENWPLGLNINWGTGSPDPIVNTENFSARFTSVQSFDDGNYIFVITSDDGVRVFIDGVLVLDQYVGRVLTTDIFQQTMTAGAHSMTVEYVEYIDQAAIQFQWFRVGDPSPGLPPGIYDGRVNLSDLAAPVAVYCHPYGIHVYAIDSQGAGTLALTVTPETLKPFAGTSEAALIASSVGEGGAIELWHTQDDRLLLRAYEPQTGKVYDFVWDGC